MAVESPNAQVDSGPLVLSWDDVYARLQRAPEGRVYGVPRGGAVVAGLLGRAVDRPELADVIVDDIVDSGATRDRWLVQGKRFWPLVDKSAEGLNGTWVRFPWEETDPTKDLADTVIRQLEWMGEDPSREGLRDTPRRVLQMWAELTDGYRQDPATILGTSFTQACDEMIVLREIEFFSTCEHHLLPFGDAASVGYIPATRVVGISKLARLVQCFARRLQIQERLTLQIAEAIMTHLVPVGVGVVLRAKHLCMACRGLRLPQTELVTSAMLGAMRERPEARAEFFRLADGGH